MSSWPRNKQNLGMSLVVDGSVANTLTTSPALMSLKILCNIITGSGQKSPVVSNNLSILWELCITLLYSVMTKIKNWLLTSYVRLNLNITAFYRVFSPMLNI